MQVNWPFLLQQNAPKFKIIGQSLEPQVGLSGATSIVPSMNARWAAEIDVQVRGHEATLQFEAFIAGMEGHIGTTLVPVKHARNPRDRDGHRVVQCSTAELSDSETMEHWGLVNNQFRGVELASSASLRATDVLVRYVNTSGLRPGHLVQIGNSLCRVQLVWEEGDFHRVRFQPPLRSAALEGSIVVIDTPALKMRLTNPDSLVVNQLSRVTQYFTLQFEEVV